MNKMAILGLVAAAAVAAGGCGHKPVKQDDTAAAEAEKAKAAAAADAKRFQEVMDLLHKLKQPDAGAASTSDADTTAAKPAPPDAGKEAETPKPSDPESGGQQ